MTTTKIEKIYILNLIKLRQRILFTLCFSIYFLNINNIYSQIDNTNYNSMGNYFIVAFTPNDMKEATLMDNSFIITSNESSNISVTNLRGIELKINYKENTLLRIDNNTYPGFFTNQDEIWNSEFVSPVTFQIKSTNNISLQVHIKKGFSSETYIAMPVGTWGNHYIHNSFYDNNELGERSGGFIILASEDNTKIDIKLSGKGKEFGKTKENKSIGERIFLTLNTGELYSVSGDGKSRGVFDLSGTDIKSDKPIGVISYHNRSLIPAFSVERGRSHLVEFILPTNLWGKNFITTELNRGTNKGDYFRILAMEDNTEITVNRFTSTNLEFIESINFTLQANTFKELDSIIAVMPHDNISLNNINEWVCSKPCMLVHYSYSSDFDGNSKFKPFMTMVPPNELYTKKTSFSTAYSSNKNDSYNDNYLNLAIIGSNFENANEEAIMTTTINGNSILSYIDRKDIKTIQTKDTRINLAQIQLPQGQYNINSEGLLGGIIYGTSNNFSAYGHPAIISFGESKIINSLDDLEIKDVSTIFPNPTSDRVSVDLGVVAVADLSIYDILGNEIMSIPYYTNKSEIDVSKLSIGTYTIQIQTKTGSMSQRLLVNR